MLFGISASFLIALAISPTVHAATVTHVVIAKIQIVGTSAKDEFVELYNPTDAPVSISGWRLSKQTASGTTANLLTTFPDSTIASKGALRIASSDYAGSVTADLTYSTQNSIAAGNTILLYSDNGNTVIDKVGFGSATNVEGSAAPNPESGQVLSRRYANEQIQDTDNNAADFELTGAIPVEAPPTPPPENPTPVASGGGVPRPALAQTGALRINEFVSDPADNDTEWVELFNTTTATISSDGWTLANGTGQVTALSGSIKAGGFLVVTQPKGQLNNSGDAIIIKGPSGETVDQIAYGDWNAGESNAPAAKDPNAVARIVDGESTNNDAADFALTTTPTKGLPNGITEESGSSSTKNTVATSGLKINELLPNPFGSGDDEFIELLNTASAPIDATGWQLSLGDSEHYTINTDDFSSTMVDAGGYFVVPRSVSRIAIKNFGGDAVRLIAPNKTRATDTARYKEDAPENQSFALTDQGWLWMATPTPGEANIFLHKDKPPVATLYLPTHVALNEAVVMSAEDSFDPEHEPLTYNWFLGDGANATGEVVVYTYPHAGTYPVTLTVTDDHGNQKKIQQTVTVGENATAPAGRVAGISTSHSALTLNELFPSPPTGNDEWIELYNDGATPISLAGWSVEDASGRRFTLTEPSSIAAFGYVLLPKTQTHIALNNTGDTVTLLNANGDEVDSVTYPSSTIGTAYARNEDDVWVWTTTTTPGAKNTVDQASSITTPTGGELIVSGTVLAEPNTFATNALYLTHITASSGIENLRVDLDPTVSLSIARGDRLQVSGSLHLVSGEPRLRVTEENAITLLGGDDTELVAELYQETAEKFGTLMAVDGTVDKGNSTGFALITSENKTIRVVMPVGVTQKRPYAVGTPVTVTGILSLSSAGFRLLTRDADDIVAAQQLTTPTTSTAVVTAPPETPWSINYYLATGIGLIALAGALAYRWWWNPSPVLPFDIIDEEETV